MPQKSKKPIIVLSIVAIVVAILAVVAAFACYTLFMSPEKRLEKQLNLGNRYLEEEDYDNAMAAFDKAIEIDRKCIAAYIGGIAARKEMDNDEKLQQFYEKSLGVVEDLEEEILEDNEDDVVRIYCDAATIYAEEPEKAMDVMEDGYKLTDGNKEIYKELSKEYTDTANACQENDEYEKALEIYDRWIEIKEDAKAIEGLDSVLEVYMDVLSADGDLDTCQKLADQYGEISSIDFDSWMMEAQEEQQRRESEDALLSRVYEYMSKKDYSSLSTLYLSDETTEIFSNMEKEYIWYASDGATETYTGKVAGLYKGQNGSTDYYFYFGAVKEGSREGQGTSFIAYGQEAYLVEDATWKNDAPNGPAHLLHQGYDEVVIVTDGTMKNGYWDGQVARTVQDDFGYYDLSFTASEGTPTKDVTEAFLEEHFGEYFGEDEYVIAYDSIGDEYWYTYIKSGTKVGAIGYGDYF